MGLLQAGYDGQIIEDRKTEGEELPDTFSLHGVSLEKPEQLLYFVNQMIHGSFGNIFRAKGHVRAGDQLLQFDIADGRYCVTGMETEQSGKAVFIGNKIDRQKIRRIFYKKRENYTFMKNRRREKSGN